MDAKQAIQLLDKLTAKARATVEPEFVAGRTVAKQAVEMVKHGLNEEKITATLGQAIMTNGHVVDSLTLRLCVAIANLAVQLHKAQSDKSTTTVTE